MILDEPHRFRSFRELDEFLDEKAQKLKTTEQRRCSQCQAPIATGRKCHKCKLRSRRKRDRERQRRYRKSKRAGVTHFGNLGPCKQRTYERDSGEADPQDLRREMRDEKRDMKRLKKTAEKREKV